MTRRKKVKAGGGIYRAVARSFDQADELRNPLSAIPGWTRMINAVQFNEELFARAVAVIDRNANLQARLIEDLLDMLK